MNELTKHVDRLSKTQAAALALKKFAERESVDYKRPIPMRFDWPGVESVKKRLTWEDRYLDACEMRECLVRALNRYNVRGERANEWAWFFVHRSCPPDLDARTVDPTVARREAAVVLASAKADAALSWAARARARARQAELEVNSRMSVVVAENVSYAPSEGKQPAEIMQESMAWAAMQYGRVVSETDGQKYVDPNKAAVQPPDRYAVDLVVLWAEMDAEGRWRAIRDAHASVTKKAEPPAPPEDSAAPDDAPEEMAEFRQALEMATRALGGAGDGRAP